MVEGLKEKPDFMDYGNSYGELLRYMDSGRWYFDPKVADRIDTMIEADISYKNKIAIHHFAYKQRKKDDVNQESIPNQISRLKTLILDYAPDGFYLCEPTLEEFEQLRENLNLDVENGNRGEKTIDSYLKELQSFYRTIFNSYNRPDVAEVCLGQDKEFDYLKRIKDPERQKEPVIITGNEVMEMYRGAPTVREKCLIMTMFELGCRCSEIHELDVSDVEPINEQEMEVKLPTKKNKDGRRTLTLQQSYQVMKRWLENRPSNGSSALFVNIGGGSGSKKGDRMKKEYISKRIKEVAKDTIGKEVKSHDLRHSSSNYWGARLKVKALMSKFGWNDPDMIDLYGDKDFDELRKQRRRDSGIDQENKKHKQFEIVECENCKRKNPPTEKRCVFCPNELKKEGDTVAYHEKMEDVLTDIFNVSREEFEENRKEFVEIMREKGITPTG
jgi:integrase